MKSRRFVTMFVAFLTTPLFLLGSGCGGDADNQQPTTPDREQPAARGQAPGPDGTRTAPPASARDQDTAAPGAMDMQQMMQRCPMMVEGVNVQATDTENGIAMVFTTNTGDVEELRRRVRGMAEMYHQHTGGDFQWHPMGDHAAGMGHGPGGGQGAGMGHGGGMHDGAGQGMGPMPAAVAAVEDVEGGARLVLTPRDTAQAEALRAHVRMHAERMRTHECPMMQQ